MADPRRRGRGRSGRGGRIPKKGEGQTAVPAFGESFVSFPLEVGGPIHVAGPLDGAAVQALIVETLDRERRQLLAVSALHERTGAAELADLRADGERHRDTLEHLARTLGAETTPPEGEEPGEAPGVPEALARQQSCRLGWVALQRTAYASGDKRIDRAVKPVLRDKERHAELLEAFAARETMSQLFRDPDE